MLKFTDQITITDIINIVQMGLSILFFYRIYYKLPDFHLKMPHLKFNVYPRLSRNLETESNPEHDLQV
jgi:hypothetical protein